MKRLASGLLLSLLLLVGCGPIDNDPVDNESKSQSATPSITQTSEPTQSTLPTNKDDVYLIVVKRNIDDSNLDDEQLLRLADSACSSARDGDNFFKTVNRIEESGLTANDSAYLVGAAFAAYCPEELDNIPGV
jgi:hypothetical protein